jgi:hypothetical protein
MPRRHFNYRYRNVPVLDLRVQAEGRPPIELADSGATRTALSIEHAEQLGLKPEYWPGMSSGVPRP